MGRRAEEGRYQNMPGAERGSRQDVQQRHGQAVDGQVVRQSQRSDSSHHCSSSGELQLNEMDELIRYAPPLAVGFLKNLQLAVICAVISLLVGTLLVIMRVAPTPLLRAIGGVYVDVLRNTPLTLVLAFSALGLSDTLGLTFS